jgi:hypothetical protein
MNRTAIRTASLAAGTVLALGGFAGVAAANNGGGHGKPTSHLTHTHLTLRATQTRVTKNDKFKASVVGTLRAHHAALANETVALDQRQQGHTWVDTGQSATTDANGQVTFTFTQSATKQQYRLVFAGDATYAHSHSGTITIRKMHTAK